MMVWWAGDSIGIIIGFPIFYFLYQKYFSKDHPDAFAKQMGFLAISGLLSIFFYIYAVQAERENIRLRFRSVADVAFQIDDQAFGQIMRAQAKLSQEISYQASFNREYFQQHAELILSGVYQTPGIFALSWNPIVMIEDREALEQLAQQQGYENFSIAERDSQGQLQVASKRPFYVPVFHIEPMASNAAALGFDIYSDPSRRKSIEEALRLNAPVLTEPVELVQIKDGRSATGALLIWPVHNQISGAEARPTGFLVAVIQYDGLLAQSGRELVSGASVTMFDVTQNATRVFANDNVLSLNQPEEASPRRPFLISKTFALAGRQLQVFAEPSAQFLEQNKSLTPTAVLLGSMLLSLLGTILFSQRLRNRAVLERLLNRTSQIIVGTPDAIVVISEKGRVTEWNNSAVEMFGYSSEEAIGKLLVDLILPARFENAHNKGLQEFAPGKYSRVMNHTLEVIAHDAMGEEFPVELSVRTVSIAGVQEYIGSMRDLRPRKKFEDKRIEIEKMEVIGQLTGGLAHDFNNLLSIVISNLDYLNRPNLPADLATHANHAMDAALRAAQVTRSLMAVARRELKASRPEEINSHLTELLPLIATTVGKHVHLDTHLCELPLYVSIDKTGFTSSIINLLLNARDAVEGRYDSVIQISTREVLLPNGDLGLPPGRFACVSVSDNGAGIPGKILKRIIEPFFTTKDRGHGTGLGLAMVYGFAQQSNGSLNIESEEMKGTTASLYLPILESHEVESDVRIDGSSDLSVSMSPRRVLVVDDEELLRRIASHIIAEMGFVVIQAASGDEALQVLRNEQVDILFSDISMPGSLDGIQLAKWVDSQLPEVSIVLTTGYVEYRRFERLLPSWQFLEKPYLREDLLRVLRLA